MHDRALVPSVRTQLRILRLWANVARVVTPAAVIVYAEVTSKRGSQLPLKKHHSATAILTIHSLQSV